MIDTIASIYVFIEAYWRFGLFVAIVFGVFWLFTNLQTDKPLGLLNQLAYGVWVVVKYTALGIWWVLKKAYHYTKQVLGWLLVRLRDLLMAFR